MKSILKLMFLLSFALIFAACDDDDDTNNNNTNNTNNSNNTNLNCGNGTLDTGETCDATNLDGNDCTTIPGNFTGGDLSCNATCTGFVTTACIANETCGNGTLDTGETCDGTNLDDNDCTTIGQGFTGGTLSCASNCGSFNTSNCITVTQQCGNDIKETGENCDGSDLAGATCESLGFSGGTLKCSDNCTYNAADCTAPTCGDGEINGLEVCESGNLGGQDCTTIGQGFVGGTLQCNSNCQFDTSNCLTCGNNVINSGEMCDGSNLNGESCLTIGHGFVGGTLACNGTCDDYDTTGCTLPTCGDNMLHGLETCDGTNLDGNTCASIGQGFTGGTLACNGTCDGWDTSSCTLPPCGDNNIEGLELCDGTNLNGNSCTSVPGGFVSGTLACNATCNGWNTSACNLPACGDGSKNGSELCDGTDLDGYTCVSIGEGFFSGTLACNSTCDGWDTSACNAPMCGDGFIHAPEVCDSANLSGNTCTSIGMGFLGGILTCLPDCSGYDTSACITPTCGNYIIEGLEQCDGMELNGNDCTDLGFTGGTLSCGTNCKYNKLACTNGCGNGVKEGTEECDINDLGTDTCGDYGFTGGNMSCNENCTLSVSECTGGCGNGVIEGTEVCDSENLDGAACSDLGLAGTPTCASDCSSIDYSPCEFVYETDDTVNFAWIEIKNEIGVTEISTLDDTNSTGPYPIGFDLPFYSATKNQIYVSANGLISFDSGIGSDTNSCPVGSSTYNNFVSAYWDDLNPDAIDKAYIMNYSVCPWGSSGQGCTIVEFDNWHHYSYSSGVIAGTFEIILFEDGNILIQWLDSGAENGLSSSTGIKGTSSADSTTYVCNTASTVSDNLSVCFVRPGTSGCY